MSYGEKDTTKVTVGCPGFGALLTIAFIILKLCGVITWSWFWVLSPLIFTIALTLVITVIVLILAVWFDKTFNNSKKKKKG